MKEREREAVILALADELRKGGSWCGETHLQKATYFLEELANIPLDLDFILYKHGPFSFDLRDEITAMRADELMEISLQPNPYGPSLLTTENGHRLQERWSDTLSRYADTITFVAEHIGDLAVAELERLATALYVRKTNPQESVQLSARRLNELKPHVSMQEAQAALKRWIE